jgi:hypothetical protein
VNREHAFVSLQKRCHLAQTVHHVASQRSAMTWLKEHQLIGSSFSQQIPVSAP